MQKFLNSISYTDNECFFYFGGFEKKVCGSSQSLISFSEFAPVFIYFLRVLVNRSVQVMR